MGRGEKNEREAALFAIIEVLERQTFIQEALAGTAVSGEGRAYVGRVVRGVVERAIELDERIACYASMKLKRMHPVVRNILRLGCFELRYLDQIPGSASVNECVKLAKACGQQRASGMINAILRKIASGSEEALTEAGRVSMPAWIWEMWRKRFGRERALRIAESFLAERPPVLRVNPSRISPEELRRIYQEEGIALRPIESLPGVFVLEQAGSVETLPGFVKGWFYIQDAGAIRVLQEAGLQPGERVLDCCASPGGKAFLAAELVGASGFVEARDKTDKKVALLRENAARLHYSHIRIRKHDALVWEEASREAFDLVIADVPCSGLGVLGRRPEIKYRLKKEDIESLTDLQSRIFDCVCGYVRPGGRLLYATCTISEAENEAQTAAFLRRHPEFEFYRERLFFPDEGEVPQDGFYACVMRRKAGSMSDMSKALGPEGVGADLG
ncbi:MAG: 16S rRNA (cytosine(967)-C(5))-methyltransferase RsmB [Lachnospiraceae bacterium]|nr:16S rRNA (cytosine(967)-C(5))-methyltransferase RsmB [Lachnospiraceae bacterium]